VKQQEMDFLDVTDTMKLSRFNKPMLQAGRCLWPAHRHPALSNSPASGPRTVSRA